MIETVITERENGERQVHQQAEVRMNLRDVTVFADAEGIDITITGTKPQMKRLLKRIAAGMEKAAK